MRYRRGVWQYSQRYTLELCFVVGIWGILTYIAITILPANIFRAYLTEPVEHARSIQTSMRIDSAFTGRWPAETDPIYSSMPYPEGVSGFYINNQGGIDLQLQYEPKGINAHSLAFNLGTLDAGNGYKFYSWYCGNSAPAKGYVLDGKIISTVAPEYTHTVCRK